MLALVLVLVLALVLALVFGRWMEVLRVEHNEIVRVRIYPEW